MTKFRKIAALMLCVVMLFTFASCRTENENVLVYTDASDNEVAIRSALYILYQIDAAGEYQTEYDEQTTTAVESDTDTTSETEVDYAKTSLDDKTYNEWVEEKAIALCAQYAYVELEFDKAELSLDEATSSEIDSAIEQQWGSYSEYFEKNGVAKSTFNMYITNMYKQELLFDHYYGEGGSKEVSADEMGKYLLDNSILVQHLSYATVTYDESYQQVQADEATVTEYTNLLKGYADRLNKGEDYAKLRAEYFTAIGETDSTDISGIDAKYPYASVMGKEDTGINPFEEYDQVAELNYGQAKFIETDSALLVMQKVDMNEDLDYCVETNKDTIIHNLKDDEFEEMCKTGADGYTCSKNTSAIKFYRADKLQLDAE